ncbi:heme-dependent catalase [Dacryopinax primogenitus]|uniref:catalase n=1 Tax=Dacryopinax primogenitus (strain DJM 731) TaxID=1858805 RepID=M5G5Y8_DACPD|nr:heme-dependent catalase [Dacryopinax primogenitus]EJU01207.1 heme-dependent catalase [Dacryopinax primogenitus]
MTSTTEKVLQTAVDYATGGSAKARQLANYTIDVKGCPLTSYFGVPQADTDTSLKAGSRGPTLLEDYHNREKISHFDHERIPERVVHARGAAAHGEFVLHTPIPELTHAAVLNDTSRRTPVFLRFSTVAGSRGSADTVRDVRGFAVRFYTEEGNWDLVGNNIPVFFIQDAIKFPDIIHAVNPEPHNEIPQAQTAHDNAWDFFSLTPETSHMLMWIMSDRAIPRSFAMMNGFGVHSFILVNAEGRRHFVKFHWKPRLGVHSLVWDEALKLSVGRPSARGGGKFSEYISQAQLFYNSMSDVEREHITSAFSFELGKVDDTGIHERIITRLDEIDHSLAARVAKNIGQPVRRNTCKNHGMRSAFLSQVDIKEQTFTAKGRKVGIFLQDGFDTAPVLALQSALKSEGVMAMIVGPRKGSVQSGSTSLSTQFTFETCRSTHFDATYVAGGSGENYSKGLNTGRLIHAVREAYMHQKPIAVSGSAVEWLQRVVLPSEVSPAMVGEGNVKVENGVVFLAGTGESAEFGKTLLALVAKHRV